MKHILLTILVLSFFSCKNEKTTEPEIIKEEVQQVVTSVSHEGSYSQSVNAFSKSVCECLKSDESSATFSSVMLKYNSCAQNYLLENKDAPEEVTAFISNSSGNATAINLNTNGNILMAKTCDYYRGVIAKSKSTFMDQMQTTNKNVDNQIETLTGRIDKIDSKQEAAQAHLTLGLLYEFKGDKDKALAAYEAGSKIEALNNLNPAYLEVLSAQ